MLMALLAAGGFPGAAELAVQSAPASVRVNGVAMAWSSVASPLAPTPLLRALGHDWQVAGRPGEGSGWWVLRHREGDQLQTLQLRAAPPGGSEGYWSTLDAEQAPRPAPRLPLRLPSLAHVDLAIEQLDGAARSVQFFGRAAESPSAWLARLLRQARTSGWQEQAGVARPEPGVTYTLVRDADQLEIQVLAAGQATRFIVNEHARDGGRVQGGWRP